MRARCVPRCVPRPSQNYWMAQEHLVCSVTHTCQHVRFVCVCVCVRACVCVSGSCDADSLEVHCWSTVVVLDIHAHKTRANADSVSTTILHNTQQCQQLCHSVQRPADTVHYHRHTNNKFSRGTVCPHELNALRLPQFLIRTLAASSNLHWSMLYSPPHW